MVVCIRLRCVAFRGRCEAEKRAGCESFVNRKRGERYHNSACAIDIMRSFDSVGLAGQLHDRYG